MSFCLQPMLVGAGKELSKSIERGPRHLICLRTEKFIDTCVKSYDSIILYGYIWAGTLFVLNSGAYVCTGPTIA